MNKNERIILVKRKFYSGKKKPFSFRISEKLMKRIKYISKKKQWTVTDLVNLSLDLLVQWEEELIEIVQIK